MLVVDDSETNRDVLLHQVTAWDMDTACAENGREALALLRTAAARSMPYRLALIDKRMPGMDGFELASAIKSDAAISQVRLILLTSGNSIDERTSASVPGIAASLRKPVRQADLCRSVVEALGLDRKAPSEAPAVAAADSHFGCAEREARVLLAEDNPVNQELALAMLEGLGLRVEVADDGRAAVERATTTRYDLILMDCQIPELDGFEATAMVRKHEAAALLGLGGEASSIGRRTPIVALTANALDGDRERCLAAGMDDYLAKPFSQDQLRAVLRRWLASGIPPNALERTTADDEKQDTPAIKVV